MQLTLSTYGGSSRVLKMGIFGGWSPENGNFSKIDYLRRLFQGPENGNFWGLES